MGGRTESEVRSTEQGTVESGEPNPGSQTPHSAPQLPEFNSVLRTSPYSFTAHLVDTPEAFDAFLAQLRRQKSISLDTETTNVWPRWAKLVGISLCWNETEAWYLPLRAPAGEPHLDLKPRWPP